MFEATDRGLAAGDKYLDRGTLHVAKFDAGGSGEWIQLTHGANRLTGLNPVYPFADQASVLVHARLAADAAREAKPTLGRFSAALPYKASPRSRRPSRMAIGIAKDGGGACRR